MEWNRKQDQEAEKRMDKRFGILTSWVAAIAGTALAPEDFYPSLRETCDAATEDAMLERMAMARAGKFVPRKGGRR